MSRCTCGHEDGFHIDELYPGAAAVGSPCLEDMCQCRGFKPCGHDKVEWRQNLGGEWAVVCDKCGTVIGA